MNNFREIPTEKIESGIEKLFDNVKDLLVESKLLLDNGRWSRSYALSQLALEELAKIFLLYQVEFDRINNISLNESQYEEIFKNHKSKTRLILIMERTLFEIYLQTNNEMWAQEYLKECHSELDSVAKLNENKNESLYVTIKNNDFQKPSEAISEVTASEFYGKVMFRKEIFQIIKSQTRKYLFEIAKLFKEYDKN